jgi:phage gp46-like protein
MDLALTSTPNGTTFDLALDGYDLASEQGLRSAVLVSLFTDRRAAADDEIPDGTNDRRGSWMDSYPAVARDQMGSRLWLLARAKELPDTLERARAYTLEALQWLIDDGVAAAVNVEAFWVRREVLGLRVGITLADRSQFEDVFEYTSEAA